MAMGMYVVAFVSLFFNFSKYSLISNFSHFCCYHQRLRTHYCRTRERTALSFGASTVVRACLFSCRHTRYVYVSQTSMKYKKRKRNRTNEKIKKNIERTHSQYGFILEHKTHMTKREWNAFTEKQQQNYGYKK